MTRPSTDRSTAQASASRSPDPTGELRFLVEVPGLQIGRFSECSGLTMEYEILEYQEGGQLGFVHRLRGQLKYPNLTLKRGMTHESALMKWFFEAQSRDRRPTLTVFLLGPDTAEVRHWAFAGAFPVKWQGPSLNAASTSIAGETLEIAHAGLVPTT
jgi:phage tail-like protein